METGMMYYPLAGNEINLYPLGDEKGIRELAKLCEKKDFLDNSQIFGNEINLSDSSYPFNKLAAEAGYCLHNRLYIITDVKASEPSGIVGFKDLDFIQRRAEMVLVMPNDAIKRKLMYEPLKLLLKKAIGEWQLRRLWMRVKESDTQIITVLKGFGFRIEGTLREELKVGNEKYDVNILGLLDKDFRFVENA
jgi:RimJ/RimL family protein N-acetyltransferase